MQPAGILIVIVLNLQINLENITILTILTQDLIPFT